MREGEGDGAEAGVVLAAAVSGKRRHWPVANVGVQRGRSSVRAGGGSWTHHRRTTTWVQSRRGSALFLGERVAFS